MFGSSSSSPFNAKPGGLFGSASPANTLTTTQSQSPDDILVSLTNSISFEQMRISFQPENRVLTI